MPNSLIKHLGLGLAILGLSFLSTSCNNTQTAAVQGDASENLPPTEQGLDKTKFDNVTINVISLTKPVGATIANHAREFEALTGAKIVTKTASYNELYQTVAQDLTTGKNQYDVIFITTNWMPDYVESGYLKNLTDLVKDDPNLAWEDIASFYRKYGNVYKDGIYSVPVDGNYHLLYYRADLLNEAGFTPPDTWEEYLEIAKYFHGKDLNGDGTPDYGSCLPKKPGNVTYWAMWSIAASLLQSQGTQQGTFFDPETMKPLVNNAGFAKALNIYKATNEYGSPEEIEWGLNDGRQAFVAGKCALAMDHGDIGTLALLPGSQVKDKFGTAIMPGSTEVLDRKTGKLVECDKFICPFAVNGVNHAPFASAIGWAGAVNAASSPEVQAAGYAFISYISQPIRSNLDVTNGNSGFNTYRISQFSKSEKWLEAGMNPEVANKYLGGIGGSINSPNVVLDLTIPQNYQYLRELLDAAVSDFLAGKISRDETMDRIYQDWEKLTNELGREKQKKIYRTGLGLDP